MNEIITNNENTDKITINNFFDHVYLLNLDRRPERLERSSKKLKEFNIEFERFSAVDGNTFPPRRWTERLCNHFALGCLFSHIEMIKDAKKNNYKSILIFEDDVSISKSLNEKIQVFKNFTDWKLIYLGATKFSWEDSEECISKNLGYIFPKKAYGTYAYALHNSVYDEIINIFEEDHKNNTYRNIDYLLIECIQEKYFGKCFTLYPSAAIHDVTQSDIAKHTIKYLTKYKHQVRWNLLDDYI